MWRSRQYAAFGAAAMLTVIMMGTAAAQSQPPAPSTGKPGKPPQDQPRRREQPPASDERGTENSPVAVKIIPAPKTETEAAQDKAERDAKAATERRMVWLTGALVLVGLIQALVFFIQARRLRETIDATRDTTDVMRDTAQRQLRAYVFVHKIVVENIFDPDSPVTHIILKNTGLTPAYKLTAWAGMDIREYPLRGPFDFLIDPVLPKHILPAKGLLNKYVYTMLRRPRRAISAQEQVALRTTTTALYVFGEISYEDAFTTNWTTTFRFMIGGPAGVRSDGACVVCEDGNEERKAGSQ